MRNVPFFRLEACIACVVILCCSAVLAEETSKRKSNPFNKKNVEEEVESVGRAEVTFPPKPPGVTAKFSIDSPQIVLGDRMAIQLGGTEIGDMVSGPLENALNNSERFRVLTAGKTPYTIRAKLSDLRIAQQPSKSGGGVGGFFGDLFSKAVNVNGKPVTADWSKEELTMLVQCGISLQLLDNENGGEIIAGETGMFKRVNTTKAIRADLAGLRYGSGGGADPSTKTEVPQGQVTADFQSQIIELAAVNALEKMLAKLDERLKGMSGESETKTAKDAAPADPKEEKPIDSKDSVAKTTPTLPQEPVQNPTGGAKPAATFKFCPHCGEKILVAGKFCAQCGKGLQ